jgi:hypothetical protein
LDVICVGDSANGNTGDASTEDAAATCCGVMDSASADVVVDVVVVGEWGSAAVTSFSVPFTFEGSLLLSPWLIFIGRL